MTTRLVTVTTLPDTDDEPSERFVIDLPAATNATIGDAQGLVTLVNDDSASPDLAIGNAANVVELAGNATMTFTVTLSAPVAAPVTVNYATTTAGTATAATDFTATSGLLTFNPGQTSKQVAVTIPADSLDEPTETVVAVLSGNSINANLLDAQAQGIILDDDPASTLNMSNIMVVEGNAGTANATFTLTLAPASGQTVIVPYTTRDGTASSATGLGLDDYETRSGVLIFPPGTVQRTLAVPVAGDRVTEATESFVFELTSATGATLMTSSATATITNDDAVPALVINSAQVPEGPAGLGSPMVFSISLSGQSLLPVTVGFSTQNVTAIAGQDYVALTDTVAFAPGATLVNHTVYVLGDGTVEANETFNGRLANAMNASITTATATATIANDD